ncbi:MAG: Holliday junction branch migration DNA helicase RuvB [Cyanobacteria bacterium J06621_8]
MAIKRASDSPETPKRASKPSQVSHQNYEVTLLSPQANQQETEHNEAKIRPQKLEDYIGQKDLKGILQIAIAAAKGREEPLDHLLLYGPPGLGKTTMSLILASEMGVECKITSAPALERPRDITGLLVGLKPGDIIFIDEIHRLNRMTEELLYPAMEDFRLDITIGKGQTAKTRSIPLPPFTLVGATTKAGALSSPLRDRFGIIQRLRFYELDELTAIVNRTAAIMKASIAPEAATEIARRSRGTPRIANRLLRRVRDYVQVQQGATITQELAATAMDLFDVDTHGLDWTDRLVLTTIIEQFNGGPVGLEAIAAATGEDRKTIEEVYEPFLLQNGYLSRTHRGRVATVKACQHLGYQSPEPKQTELF